MALQWRLMKLTSPLSKAFHLNSWKSLLLLFVTYINSQQKAVQDHSPQEDSQSTHHWTLSHRWQSVKLIVSRTTFSWGWATVWSYAWIQIEMKTVRCSCDTSYSWEMHRVNVCSTITSSTDDEGVLFQVLSRVYEPSTPCSLVLQCLCQLSCLLIAL